MRGEASYAGSYNFPRRRSRNPIIPRDISVIERAPRAHDLNGTEDHRYSI